MPIGIIHSPFTGVTVNALVPANISADFHEIQD
jgi:hypothetical protein